MSKYKYPETVPVLNGNDFCSGMKNHGENAPPDLCKRCLIGHAVYVFLGKDSYITDDYNKLPRRVKQALNYAVNKMFKINGVNKGAVAVYVGNDSNVATRYGRARVAKAWNIAMAYLGYTDGNPEA